MLTARTEYLDYVEAADAVRGTHYNCRECRTSVILKTGKIRIAHFAHRPDSTCSSGSKMSLAHLTAQRQIADSLRERGVNVELEFFSPSLAGDRRIDVLAWHSAQPNIRVAIEVQASNITQELVSARTHSYNAENIAPIWLRLINFDNFKMVQTLQTRNTIWLDRYRACAWERWAHDQLGGRLWFLDQATFLAWRGVFIPAHRYRKVSSWYDSYGEEQSAGGDWREIVQSVELELEGPFELASLLLKRGRLQGTDKTRRLGAWFVTPEEIVTVPTESMVRAEFKQQNREQIYREIQIQFNGQWIPATFSNAPSNWQTSCRSSR